MSDPVSDPLDGIVYDSPLGEVVFSTRSRFDGPREVVDTPEGPLERRRARRLTWREVAQEQQEELDRARAMAAVLADLNRCEHGRHEDDVCSSCGGPSKGNPFMVDGRGVDPRRADAIVVRQIGWTLGGEPIVVPDRERMHDPTAWRAPGR